MVGDVGSAGENTAGDGCPDVFFRIDTGEVLFLAEWIEGAADRGVVGVAKGVESPELNDGEGGSGAIEGVGNKTSGFGARLRTVKGGGAGNKDSEKPVLRPG